MEAKKGWVRVAVGWEGGAGVGWVEEFGAFGEIGLGKELGGRDGVGWVGDVPGAICKGDAEGLNEGV